MMHRIGLLMIGVAIAWVAQGGIGMAQTRDAEAAAKQTLDRFITEWNTADDANLREVLSFPFVSVAGGGGLVLDRRPEDFSQGFEQMQERG